MGDNTAIEWADATVNFAWGCTKVSPGCKNCYAERLSSARFINQSFNFHLLSFERNSEKILAWVKPKKIFLNSMTDTFHEQVTDEILDMWFTFLKSVPRHKFIILTKRINRAYNYFKTRTVPDNVWLGTSVENKNYLHRIDKLRLIKAKTRFVSFEPLIGPVGEVNLEGIHWCIVGGELDYKHPRRFDEMWALEIKEQCRIHKIAFFFKQTGGTKKNELGTWGSNKLFNTEYLEFPDYAKFGKQMELSAF